MDEDDVELSHSHAPMGLWLASLNPKGSSAPSCFAHVLLSCVFHADNEVSVATAWISRDFNAVSISAAPFLFPLPPDTSFKAVSFSTFYQALNYSFDCIAWICFYSFFRLHVLRPKRPLTHHCMRCAALPNRFCWRSSSLFAASAPRAYLAHILSFFYKP